MINDPAFPSISNDPPVTGHDLPMDRWMGGLTKREYAAIHLAAGFAASGKAIPELKSIWDMADKLFQEGGLRASGNPPAP